MDVSLSPFAPENLVSRDGFGRPAPRQLAHLHTQAESADGPLLISILRLNQQTAPSFFLKSKSMEADTLQHPVSGCGDWSITRAVVEVALARSTTPR